MNEKTTKWAAAAIGATGLIHLVLAPDQFEEEAYVGVLFIVGAVACGYAALKLWTGRETTFGWLLGSAAAACMFAGFILSRTVGLPGFHESEWELSGLVTLVLEAGFIAAAVAALSRSSQPARVARTPRNGSASFPGR
ncbi:MAG: hypothetical protein ACJ740_17445 [Gaiellales bacterium]